MDITAQDIRGDANATTPRLLVEFAPDLSTTNLNRKDQVFAVAGEVEMSVGEHDGVRLPKLDITIEEGHTPRVQDIDTLTGVIPLPHSDVGKIEELRTESEPLGLTITLHFTLQADNNGNINRASGRDKIVIEPRDWEAVLDDLGYHDKRVVELSIPDSQIGDVLENAHGQLKKAQEHHDARRYDDAVAAARKAILKLDHIKNDERVADLLGGEQQERVFDAIDEFRESLMSLKAVADLGSHPEEQITGMDEPITRADSELVIDVTKAYVRYVSRVIEGSEESAA